MYRKGDLIVRQETYYEIDGNDGYFAIGDRAALLALFWDAAEALGYIFDNGAGRYIAVREDCS